MTMGTRLPSQRKSLKRVLTTIFFASGGIVFLCLSSVESQVPLTTHPIKPGVLLMASPNLLDPNFRETVVLVCQHDAHGTVGLILNRPSDIPMSTVFSDVQALKEISVKIYTGGPVHPKGMLLLIEATQQPANTREVLSGVYFGGSVELVEQMITDTTSHKRFRFYAGYASWFPGQLHMEIQSGAWATLPGKVEYLFDEDPGTQWSRLRNVSTRPKRFISNPPRIPYQSGFTNIQG